MDKQPEKYIHFTRVSVDELMQECNRLCATEEIIHGAWYSKEPTHKFITAFPNLSNAYTAVLEKL